MGLDILGLVRSCQCNACYSPIQLVTSHCCPCCFRELGMLKESEHMLKEALGTSTKVYGKESVQVAKVLNRLGGTYYISSQLQKSRYANNHYKHSCKVVFCSQTIYYNELPWSLKPIAPSYGRQKIYHTLQSLAFKHSRSHFCVTLRHVL